MLTVTCMRGLPGSGKSTYAQSLLGVGNDTTIRVSRDDIRKDNFGLEGVLGRAEENLITKIQFATATLALQNDVSVIVDDMNLRPAYLKDWNRLAVQHSAQFGTIEVPTDVETCILQDAARGARGGRLVGAEVIRSLAARFMPKGQFLPYTPFTEMPEKSADQFWKHIPFDPDLPHCILVDLDGTMTMGPRPHRSPYDWKRCGEDKPRRAVVNLVNRLLRDGYTVIFLSGRDSVCRAETVEWLGRYVDSNHGGQWVLLMRREGDSRKDDIVKSELYDTYILGQFQPKFVLDDRDQVVRMWRARGLTCFQVAEGNF